MIEIKDRGWSSERQVATAKTYRLQDYERDTFRIAIRCETPIVADLNRAEIKKLGNLLLNSILSDE